MRITRRGLLGSAVAAGAAGSPLGPLKAAVGTRPGTNAGGTLPELIEADVAVVGAGASGIPAAIAAARHGARVVLLEEDAVPGGAPVDMYVSMLCGWPRAGIFREMVDRLQRHHHLAGRPVEPREELRDTWFLPTSFLQVISAMLAAESNIRLLCGAPAVEPIVREGGPRPQVRGVRIACPGGPTIEVRAAVTIDCSGTGALAEAAGAEAMYGRDGRDRFGESHGRPKPDDSVMPCTWMYISQRFRRDAAAMDFSRLGGGANESGHGWVGADPAAARQRDAGIYLHWGCTVRCRDTRDPAALAEAQREALDRLAPDIEELFRQGFAVHLAPRIGVRECRRIVGEHVVTENDLRSARLPEDVVAIGHYYLDAWGEKLTEQEKRLPTFGIPYRALVPRGVEGMLTAGKIIGGSHLAMTAYRVQPILACVGQAAGQAAAMAALRGCGVRDVDVRGLQQGLRAAGVPLSDDDPGAHPPGSG